MIRYQLQPKGITVLERMANDLRLLGYGTEIKYAKKIDGLDILVTSHEKHCGLAIYQMTQNLLCIKANLGTDIEDCDRLYDYLNRANESMVIAKVFSDICDEKIVLRFEAVCAVKYDEDIFGELIKRFNTDVEIMFKIHDDYGVVFFGAQEEVKNYYSVNWVTNKDERKKRNNRAG